MFIWLSRFTLALATEYRLYLYMIFRCSCRKKKQFKLDIALHVSGNYRVPFCYTSSEREGIVQKVYNIWSLILLDIMYKIFC